MKAQTRLIRALTVSMMMASLFGSGVVKGQDLLLDADKLVKDLPGQCEEPSRILADAKLNKWEKRAKEMSRPVTEAQKQAVYAVMRDQCVSVQLVMLLRTLKSTMPAADWAKTGGDAKIAMLLARIEKSL
jgi:hypothetical protein